MKTTRSTLALSLALSLAIVACGDMADSASFSDVGNWQDAANADTTPQDTWSQPDAGPAETSAPDTMPPPPPPEAEVDFDLRTPEAGDTFLYIPSAALDALVVVDARSLAVHLVEVGITPTLARALPGDRGAVVLNEGSSDVSIVRPNPIVGGVSPATAFSVETLDVTAGANRLVISPDGNTAFAFFATTSQGITAGSLQDVTAMRINAGTTGSEAFNLAVGFRPEAIIFAANDSLALIICEDGISGFALADLTGDTFLPPVPTSPDAFEVPLDREILPTPDGRYALVRSLNRQALLRVDLQTGALAQLALPDYPSDLDLTADGATAVVPLRTLQAVALVDVANAFTWVAPELDPNVPPEEQVVVTNPFVRIATTGAPFGSTVITSDEHHALLYTTSPGTMAVGLLDLTTGQAVIQPTVKELEAVIASPDGKMAALLHRRASGSGDLAQRNAYSLLDLATGYTKLVVTAQPVTSVTFTRDASELFALLPDPLGASHEVQRIKTRSFSVITYRVPDRPVFVGALPALNKVAIALDNPTGWITFIDTTTDALLQLNSFELNSFIE